MDKKLLLAFVILLFLPLASAWTNNSLITSYTCYQEDADFSSSCVGNTNGTYAQSGTFSGSFPSTNAHDANWGTYADVAINGFGGIDINYTKGAKTPINLIWRINSGLAGGDKQIMNKFVDTYGCYNNNRPSLLFNYAGNDAICNPAIRFSCTTATSSTIISQSSSFCNQIFWEEALIWEFLNNTASSSNLTLIQNEDSSNYLPITSTTSYVRNAYLNLTGISGANNLTNVTLTVGNSVVWNYTGQFTQTNNRTTNFNSVINSYLSNCTAYQGFCYVPFTFRSATNGTIQYSDVYLSNEGFTENYSVYNNVTYSGAIETFQLGTVMDTPTITIQNATLNYNNTVYQGSWGINGNNVLFTATIPIPAVSVATNKTFYWSISSQDSTSNSTSNTQTIMPFEAGACGGTLDTIIFKINSLNDEGTDSLINVSANPVINLDFKIGSKPDSAIFIEYHNNYTQSSNITVCMPSALLTLLDFRLDGIISYITNNHVQEFWYIDNGTITYNGTSLDAYTSNNITLRDLLLVDSKSFQFTFYDENYNTIPNAIVTVLRNYIGEGVFKEVERAKLDSNGQTILHLVEEDVQYIFRITLNGQLIYLSDAYNAKCIETPCTITLQKGGEITTIDGTYDNLPEGTYGLTSSKVTRDVTLTFNLENTGTMTLDVYQYTSSANDPLIGTDTLTAKAGTLTVTVPLNYDNSTYYAVVNHDTEFVTSKWVDMGEASFPYFGSTGLLMGGILILTLGLISISSGGWTIVFLLVGVLTSMATKLLDMDYYLYVYIVCAGALIIWKLATRRTI